MSEVFKVDFSREAPLPVIYIRRRSSMNYVPIPGCMYCRKGRPECETQQFTASKQDDGDQRRRWR